MSVAVSAPAPLATRPIIMSKPSAPRIQSRPSISSAPGEFSRAMAPTSSRPVLNASASSSQAPRPPSNLSSLPSVPRPAPASRTGSSTSGPAPLAASPAVGKDTSSSAGRIFAKPSKEWVLPERAKPGRKVSIDEPDNKRQSQNRLSQRAHRARRTDYISTLEERLRQYEADEIHSNVRLQEVARALKNDNERLKSDLNDLKNKCMEYNGEKDVWDMERRNLKEALRDMRMEVEALRAGRGLETIVRMDIDQMTIDNLVPGPSLSRRQSAAQQLPSDNSSRQGGMALQDCPICPNPDPDCPCQRPHQHQQYPPQHLTLAPSVTDDHAAACGLCRSTDECLCNAVDVDVKPDVSSPSHNLMVGEDNGCGLCTGGDFCACREAAAAATAVQLTPSASSSSVSASVTTGIVRASAPSAAMPLRRRSKGSNANAKTSIWSLNVLPTSPRTREAVCTGDPSNCDACRDDSFGREFCQHLFEASDSLEPGVKQCSSCAGNCSGSNVVKLLSPSPEVTQASTSSSGPVRTPPTPPTMSLSMMDEENTPLAPLQMACCGNPELCGGQRGGGCTGDVIGIGAPGGGLSMPMSFSSASSQREYRNEEEQTTLRPDQAWKQLKAHPNAKFASLALLADVVARRTKCLDSRVELSPMPASPALTNGTPVPPYNASGRHSASLISGRGSPSVPASASPAASTLSQASKRRNIEVNTSAVRDALKLLDKATPAPSPTPERELKKRRLEN